MNFLANIDVDDLEEAVRFYEAAFKLKVGRRFGASGVEMLGGPAPIYLLLKAGAANLWRSDHSQDERPGQGS
jgi:catechol 2,3-dioxygenase-like lactoylglutathione lyase family enzyme